MQHAEEWRSRSRFRAKIQALAAGPGDDRHPAEGVRDNSLDNLGSKIVSIRPAHLIKAVKGPCPVLTSQFNAHERLFDAGKKPFYSLSNTVPVGDGQIEPVARHGDEPPGSERADSYYSNLVRKCVRRILCDHHRPKDRSPAARLALAGFAQGDDCGVPGGARGSKAFALEIGKSEPRPAPFLQRGKKSLLLLRAKFARVRAYAVVRAPESDRMGLFWAHSADFSPRRGDPGPFTDAAPISPLNRRPPSIRPCSQR
jgi:hypothetical protein